MELSFTQTIQNKQLKLYLKYMRQINQPMKFHLTWNPVTLSKILNNTIGVSKLL